MSPDWRLVCAQLRASKVLDRNAGMAAVRDAFRPGQSVRFDGGKDDENWVALFDALFHSVEVDRKTFFRRASNVTRDRLESGIVTIRLVVEHAVRLFQKPALTSLISSLLDACIHRLEPFPPVARECISALRVIVSYAPHVRNLEPDQWTSLLSLAFGVLLDKPLNFSLAGEHDDTGGELDDASISDSLPLPKSCKRTSVHIQQPQKRSKRMQDQFSPEQADCAVIVHALISSWQLQDGMLIRVLDLLRSVLAAFQRETAAHRSLLPALNTILSLVALDCRAATVSFARTMWSQLLSLWGTQDGALREALVITFMHLLPFYATDADNEGQRLSQADGLSELVRLAERDPDSGHGVSPLPLETLRFILREPDAVRLGIFESWSFISGPTFTPSNALSWATLELIADALQSLQKLESVSADSPKSISAPYSLSMTLGLLREFMSQARRIWILQVIVFLVERHWSSLSADVQKDITGALTALLAHDDTETQSWAFVCLSSVANFSDTGDGLVDWDLIWNFAIARIFCKNQNPL